MNSAVYLRHDHDDDMTVVTIYTYVKNNPLYTGDIYIISDHVDESVKSLVSQVYSKCKYIKPGADCKHMLKLHKHAKDITGRVFNDVSIKNITDSKDIRIAIVCYVYYPEFFQEMYNHVVKLSQYVNDSIDMYVYLCDVNSTNTAVQMIKNTRAEYNVNIILNWTQNRGRDVRSFLNFISNSWYKSYDMICKIHTKKTTYLHDNWREFYLERLLKPENYSKYNNCLNNTDTGITGVSKFEIREKHISTNINYKNLKFLDTKIKLNINNMKVYKFHAGTMFWCTSNYCEHIKNSLDLREHDKLFEEEPIKSDGTLAHAWERAFWLL